MTNKKKIKQFERELWFLEVDSIAENEKGIERRTAKILSLYREAVEENERADDHFASVLAGLELCEKCRKVNKKIVMPFKESEGRNE